MFCFWSFLVQGLLLLYTLYPLTCPTSKDGMGSDLAVTILCLLFYHQEHTVKKALDCLLCKFLNCLLLQKTKILSYSDDQEMVYCKTHLFN
jgi:hypothetical protein